MSLRYTEFVIVSVEVFFLCPQIERSGAHCFTIVRLSVCPSITDLTCKLNLSQLLLTIYFTILIFGMKVTSVGGTVFHKHILLFNSLLNDKYLGLTEFKAFADDKNMISFCVIG